MKFGKWILYEVIPSGIRLHHRTVLNLRDNYGTNQALTSFEKYSKSRPELNTPVQGLETNGNTSTHNPPDLYPLSLHRSMKRPFVAPQGLVSRSKHQLQW